MSKSTDGRHKLLIEHGIWVFSSGAKLNFSFLAYFVSLNDQFCTSDYKMKPNDLNKNVQIREGDLMQPFGIFPFRLLMNPDLVIHGKNDSSTLHGFSWRPLAGRKNLCGRSNFQANKVSNSCFWHQWFGQDSNGTLKWKHSPLIAGSNARLL